MTDVESKTPTKRKSLPANHASGKKVKLDKSVGNKQKTPGKKQSQQNGEKIGQNKKSPKQNVQNSGKKQKGKASPKKVKAFSGTVAIENPKTKNIKENQDQDKGSGENEVKKKRRSQFHQIKTKARAGDKTVVKSIEDKIKTIESRGDLSKTAQRKLKLLKRLKRVAEGKPAEIQKKAPHQKSDSTKRRERKKNLKSKQNESTGKPKQSKGQIEAEEESDDDNADNSEEEVKNADSSDEEGGSEEDAESGNEVEDSEDEAGSGDEEDGAEDEENSDDDDDEFEDECVPQENFNQHGKRKLQLNKPETHTDLQENLGSDVSQKINPNIQKRYVLFVGNIPYDTNKTHLMQHFEKCGDVINVRIPTEKKTKKPRGFAFIEVRTEESYQKCLSLHHSNLKGRKINVLYTLGGKNNEERMKKIKAKNFKLHAMRKKGQLIGSKKESQKRSFRRKKYIDNNSKIQ